MKKTLKRFLAFAMVAVMMANPVSALAAETSTEETTSPAVGSADASGDVEGFVDTTIFKVVLPTSAEGTFDFIMDPQGLIAATSGEAHTGATFEDDATLFFNTASADASGDYKSQSNYIEVLNRGTVAVNVSVEATVTGLSTIKMASSEAAFTSGDAAVPELYLAFVASGDASGDAKDAPVAVATTGSGATATTGATIEAVLPAASADYYEFNWASGNGYTFDLKADKASGDATVFPDYSFALTGACNAEADWTDVKNAKPAVNVIWTLTDAESGNPDINKTKTASSTSTISVTTAATVTSATWVTYNGASKTGTLTKGTHYSVSGTTFNLLSACAKNLTSGKTTITLNLSDGTTQTLNITVQ